MLFKEVLPAAHALMEDPYGNYAIQKFFEFGNDEQKLALVPLSTHTYGCRVIQKAIKTLPPTHQVS